MKTSSCCIMVSQSKHRVVDKSYLVLLFQCVVTHLRSMSLLVSRKELVLHTVSALNLKERFTKKDIGKTYSTVR